MDDYSSYSNGVKSRFGFGFRNWLTSNDTQPDLWANSDLFARANPHREHVCRPVIIGSDGRARPVTFECPPKYNHKQTATIIGENVCKAHSASPHRKDYATDEGKMDFSGGLFQHPRSDYSTSKITLTTEGGWSRPSPNGWNLPPETSLGRVTSNIDTAKEYLKGSAGSTSGIGWARRGPVGVGPASTPSVGQWGPTGEHSDLDEKKVTKVIDSREAVKKYGGKFTW